MKTLWKQDKLRNKHSTINKKLSDIPICVNWHLISKCNYDCKFCFGRFEKNKSILTKEESTKLLEKLATIGINKITLTGGEPLLCKNILNIVSKAKNLGLTTMIVTNGYLLNKTFVEKNHQYIDWIGLSLDSMYEDIEYALGRGFGNHVKKIRQAANLIKTYNIKLKINTVITALNYNEDMIAIIEELNPDRWKVFQVLKVDGENDGRVEPLLITEEQFMSFVNRHKHLNPIYESNDLFRGSYVMLDPLGRFFQNSKGHIEYSCSILEVDPLEALAEVGWDKEKFLKRGGIYDW